jgi:hypothetical protein
MLRVGETLAFDFSYTADGYLAHLFEKGAITMFQRRNERDRVFYKSRKDHYVFPANDFTRAFSVQLNGSAPNEKYEIEEVDERIEITINLEWPDSYAGNFSYEISHVEGQ